MKKIKAAVIGVGYLGKFHAQKYEQLQNVELVGVCDLNKKQSELVAGKVNTSAYTDYRKLIGKVDAVSIAVPTQAHFEICKDFLEAGCHVLVEKPIATTVSQAQSLIQIAKKHKCIFQVGHLERFNAALLALEDTLTQSRFIESHRLSSFNPRGTDVNVILDLMIHDIDIIQSIVKSPIVSIDAQGTPVLTKFVDIANVRLRFANGCVANVTASRISFKTERKMRIFKNDSYISIDFHKKKYAVFKKGDGEMFPGSSIPNILQDESTFEQGDALLLEIESFIDAIKYNKTPVVTGEDGLRALDTALKITNMIRSQLIKQAPSEFPHFEKEMELELELEADIA